MKYVYGITGVAVAVTAVIIGVLGMPDVMVVAALLASVLILAANADRISRLKASATGFEAETRAIIDEAQATIEQLRTVARIAVQANISLAMRSGRWGGFSFEGKESIRRASSQVLDALQVPKKDQDEMFAEWHKINRFDYAHLLLGGNRIPEDIQDKPELLVEWKALRRGGFDGNPRSDVVETFLRKSGMFNAEREKLLEDYRYYERHNEHRRPDIWKELVDRDR